MNMDTMNKCIHYEFAEQQKIDCVLCSNHIGLGVAFNKACLHYDYLNEVYYSKNSKEKLDAYAIMQDNTIVQICAHKWTNEQNFKKFCRRLANIQYCQQRKKVAA